MEGNHHLPEDIVFEIFARMPTKPLLRLRFLSKHWKHVISGYFMKSRSRRMILLPFEPLQAIDNERPRDRTVHSVSELPSFTNQGSTDHVIIVGAVNGIVLLVLKDMILYNPVTGAFKIVPDPPLDASYSFGDGYGFCYGTTPDDLKIVRISADGNDRAQPSRLCDVFSLKKGLWTTNSVTLVGRCYIQPCAGTFVNGFLYWLAITGHRRLILVALDVKEMVFSEIQLPFSPGLDCLGTSGDCLYIFRNTISKFELWVMNNHDSENSWSKVLISNGLPSVYPLSILDGQKVVMLETVEQRQFIIYDMLKDSYEAHKVINTGGCKMCIFQAMQYVESLISPSSLCSF